jgi:molybdate transport system substrate-binding protein
VNPPGGAAHECRVNVKATPRGTGAAAMVASGEADIAVMPVSEIVHAPGVELAGVIAEEIQLNQVFSAAVVAGSKQVDAAKRLIAFLASERASAAIKSGGMEPLGKRRAD